MGFSRLNVGLGCVLIVAAAGLASSQPAGADWLVMRDGSKVETRGAWEVRGRLVLFHTTDGTFSSMRLDDVTLEASHALTAAASASRALKPRVEAKAPVAPKAKFVLTDDDVGHVDPSTIPNPLAGPSNDGAGEEMPDAEFAPAEVNPLEVINWDAVVAPEAEGVTITGVLSNPTDLHAANINIEVTIMDLAGEVIAEGPATMVANALGPGDQGAFQAFFSGVYDVRDAGFEVSSFNAVIAMEPEDSDDESLGI